MFCSNCGSPIKSGEKFCTYCGNPVNTDSVNFNHNACPDVQQNPNTYADSGNNNYARQYGSYNAPNYMNPTAVGQNTGNNSYCIAYQQNNPGSYNQQYNAYNGCNSFSTQTIKTSKPVIAAICGTAAVFLIIAIGFFFFGFLNSQYPSYKIIGVWETYDSGEYIEVEFGYDGSFSIPNINELIDEDNYTIYDFVSKCNLAYSIDDDNTLEIYIPPTNPGTERDYEIFEWSEYHCSGTWYVDDYELYIDGVRFERID